MPCMTHEIRRLLTNLEQGEAVTARPVGSTSLEPATRYSLLAYSACDHRGVTLLRNTCASLFPNPTWVQWVEAYHQPSEGDLLECVRRAAPLGLTARDPSAVQPAGSSAARAWSPCTGLTSPCGTHGHLPLSQGNMRVGVGGQWYSLRRSIGLPLVSQGVACLILESPFYGRRRPASQRAAKLRAVSDLLALGNATIEVRAISFLPCATKLRWRLPSCSP